MPEVQSASTYLIVAISSLAGAIVWLALYIRTLHNRNIKAHTENTKQVLTITEKVIEAVTKFDATMQVNTKSVEMINQANITAIGSLNTTVNDLHKFIIQNTKG